MSGKTKPPYPEAFREQIVELVASGREVGELAREFNGNSQSIHNWVKKAGRLADLPRGTEITKAHRAVKAARGAKHADRGGTRRITAASAREPAAQT